MEPLANNACSFTFDSTASCSTPTPGDDHDPRRRLSADQTLSQYFLRTQDARAEAHPHQQHHSADTHLQQNQAIVAGRAGPAASWEKHQTALGW
eukprot:967780-Rhodomonas_salina.2